MTRIIPRSISVTLMFVTAALFVGGSFAEADEFLNRNRLLRGEYAVTEFRSCVQTDEGGITEEFRIVSPGNYFRTGASQQVRKYNGDGTASVTGVTTTMFIPGNANALIVSQSEVACDVQYTVNPDLSYTETLSCTGKQFNAMGEIVSTFTITPSTRMGQIAPGRNNFIYSVTDPQIQTLKFFDPKEVENPKEPGMAQPTMVRERICIRSGKGVKIRHLEHWLRR